MKFIWSLLLRMRAAFMSDWNDTKFTINQLRLAWVLWCGGTFGTLVTLGSLLPLLSLYSIPFIPLSFSPSFPLSSPPLPYLVAIISMISWESTYHRLCISLQACLVERYFITVHPCPDIICGNGVPPQNGNGVPSCSPSTTPLQKLYIQLGIGSHVS